MAEYKPLVIKSDKPKIPSTDSSDWKEFTKELHAHAKNIATGTVGAKKSNLGAIVSGVPTVFARADLFKLAIESQVTGFENKGSLNEYYDTLVGEWKGLLACIALQPQSLDIEHIDLIASNGADPENPISIYEPKHAFGTMLFEDRPKWCKTGENVPFINIIKFGTGSDKIIVGATSPESLLFTSVSYRIKDAESCPFVNSSSDADGGKFIDPVTDDVTMVHPKLTREQCGTLYAYINNLIENKIPEYKAYYQKNPDVDLNAVINNVSTILKSWLKDILKYALEIGWTEEDIRMTSMPTINCFEDLPFASVFNYSEDLWAHNGMIFTTDVEGGNRVKFDPKSLLLPKSTSDIAEFNFRGASKKPDEVEKLPVIVLPAKNEADTSIYKYFALPFTPLAVKVFGKFIGDLVSLKSTNKNILSKLTAFYAEDENTKKTVLKVKLSLSLPPSQPKEIKEEYQLSGRNMILDKNVAIWPNFVSSKWQRYFLYSEIPSSYPDNRCSYLIKPFAWDTNRSEEMPIIEEDDPGKAPQDRNPVYLDRNNVNESGLVAKKHIVANNQSDDSNFKYEIFESNKPFRGFKLFAETGQKEGGVILIDYNKGGIDNKLKSEATSHGLRDVNIGIDFGSTNTSVAYCFPGKDRDNALGLEFKDRRVELFEQTSGTGRAMPSNVFFFHRNNVKSNSLKSVLATHENRRLVIDGELDALKHEVKGGLPCFENNLPISKVLENQQELHFPYNVPATLFYNLKWSTYDLDKSHIKAYLRSIMLYTYAELFDESLQPIEVKWSYPSSMESTVVSKYQDIWSELTQVNPIVGGKPLIVDTAFYSTGSDMNDNIFNQASQSEQPWGANPNTWGQPSDTNPFGSNNDSNNGGWGATPAESQQQTSQGWSNNPSGWDLGGTKNFFQDDVNLSEEDEVIGFKNEDFEELPTKTSLTESEAVANYMAKMNSLSGDKLLLCFDVGGSTTDFSVLFKMGNYNTMLKQNSIRFAAQRVSMATKHSPNFKRVVSEMCQMGHIQLDGLQNWDPTKEPEKAPYFFDKMVDVLPSSALPMFYQKIHTYCPELFCVDLYVTGLIMYYAGQITRKLILDLRENGVLRQPPKIEIHFAGKGARIFEWLYSLEPNMFVDFYINRLFARGIVDTSLLGGQPATPNIPLREADVKFEVSKGLALMFNPEYFTDISGASNNALLAHKNRHAIEIMGEENFLLRNKSGEHTLTSLSSMTPDRMKHISSAVFEDTSKPNRMPRFKDFCGIFFQLVNNSFVKLDQQRFFDAFQHMNVIDYIMKTKEFRNAESSDKFQFVAPIIVMEGKEFYDNYLFKLFN